MSRTKRSIPAKAGTKPYRRLFRKFGNAPMLRQAISVGELEREFCTKIGKMHRIPNTYDDICIAALGEVSWKYNK